MTTEHKPIVTAAAAQELLDNRKTLERWEAVRRAGARYEVRSVSGAPVTGWGCVTHPKGDAQLLAAAPDLGDTVIALHATVTRLTAALDSERTVTREMREAATKCQREIATLLPDDPAEWSSADIAWELVQARQEIDAIRNALDGTAVPPPGDSLARQVYEVAQREADFAADLRAARAVTEGRTVAPTDHEIEAHAARGGRWRTRYQVGDPSLARDAMGANEARWVRDLMRPLHAYTWWATEADGTLCAWPVVASEGGAT